MVLAIVLAGVAVLVSVVVLAMGRGGELAEARPDHSPVSLPGIHLITGTDAALLWLPKGLWGYHVKLTDEALGQFAYALTERDARITMLERRLAQLGEAGDGAIRWDLAPGSASPWTSPADAQSWPAREPLPVPDPPDPYTGRHVASDDE